MNYKTSISLLLSVVAWFAILSVPVRGAAGEAQLSFSTIFTCGVKPNESVCLADSFVAGRVVILLKKDSSGFCTAKTTTKFEHEGLNRAFEATRLIIPSGCSGPFSIAVVGAESSSVRLGLKKPNSSDLNKYNIQARELLNARQLSFAPEAHIYRVSEASPRTITAGNAILLAYSMSTDTARGPSVLFFGDRTFVSEGWCTSGHTFFYIKEQLYLSYVETGCGGGEYAVLIYDLTSGEPQRVYVNAKFSN